MSDEAHQGCEANGSNQCHKVTEEGQHAGDQRNKANVDCCDEQARGAVAEAHGSLLQVHQPQLQGHTKRCKLSMFKVCDKLLSLHGIGFIWRPDMHSLGMPYGLKHTSTNS